MKKLILFALFVVISTTLFAQAIVEPDYHMDTCDVDTVDLPAFSDDEEIVGSGWNLRELFGDDLNLDLNSPDWKDALLSQCENRTDLKAESLLTLMLLKEEGNDSVGEDEEPVNTERKIRMYGDILKAFLEVGLYKDMGGSSNEVLRDAGQVITTLYYQIMEVMPECILEYPEDVCKEVDKVEEYLKRLDYIGDIYKDGSIFLSREEQAAVVEKITNGLLATLKSNIFKTNEELEWLWEFLTDVAKDAKKVDLKRYMTKPLLKKMKKKDILDIIAPDAPFDVANLKDCCMFEKQSADKYFVFMNTTSVKEVYSAEDFQKAKRYYVTLTKENGQYFINDLEKHETPQIVLPEEEE